ncbi:mechanosensitive ion channel [Rhizobium leguminosarum]|uniref:mechanosensitive ion channel family protein n=1 Tax=Rhizobium leguminosarum TaxID=384 RepID=UPI001C963745|nr:mechanosensitive ion channel family protein [Rhizobium leguminosarum]MBY5533695.1 mechanosensitive ion channel [Rhizobium leguminosarum]
MAGLVDGPLVQFVLLLLLRGAVRVVLRDSRLGKLVLDIVFFSVLTSLLLYNGITPYLRDREAMGMAKRVSNGALKTIWWLGGSMVLASSVRMFLIFERKPREGRLLQDLVVALIYLTASLCIVAYVFSLPVGTIIATSGVFAIVLGLALQSTLNDVFSGIALNLGRPLSVGDWIVLDDQIQGRVVETNWRSTQLVSPTNDLVVVPNSLLAKSRITNLSSPDFSHGASLRVRIAPDKSPATILDVVDRALLSSNSIMKDPPPTAVLFAMDRDAIEVELSFRVENIARVNKAKNELFDLVFRHMDAAGLELAYAPGSVQVSVLQHDGGSVVKRPTPPMRLVTSIPLFAALTDTEKEDLAAGMNRVTFKRGELISRRDASSTSLMIIRSGVAAMEETEEEQTFELSRLAPGDLFGERGVLMGLPEVADIRALTAVVVYEIQKEHLAAVLRERPLIAEDLAHLLSTRMEAEDIRHHPGLNKPNHSIALTLRIRQLFRLS